MPFTNPSYTIDTAFDAPKNIASAASVYTFTAAASAKVQFIVKLTNAAGNGDYIIYLTRQWLGTGTAAVCLGKATLAAASGETVIEFTTMQIHVKTTDVIDVMIDGLAGDTAVNGNIRIVADNPSVFDAGADTVTLADGGITAAKIATDAIGADEVAAGAVTKIQSGLSTLTAAQVWAYATRTLSSFGTLVADIWAYVTRTLTATSAATQAAMTGSALAITHGFTYSATISGLTIPATWSKIFFTIKRNATTDTDAESVLQIVESATPAATDGILYLNGAPVNSTIRDYGSLTVSQVAGTIVVTLDDALDLSTLDGIYTYDLKALKSDGTSVQLSGSGSVTIGFSETRSIV